MLNRYVIMMIVVVLPLASFASGRNYVPNMNSVWLFTSSSAPTEAAPQVEVSEVTSASAPAAETGAMTTSLRPEARPAGLQSAQTTPPRTNPGLYDMRGCTYLRGRTDPDCYGSMSTVDRARRIMHAVNYINGLHETRFDGRYMLCTGYRESTFNPGAKGADGERGMFQVMAATGRGALRYGVELPEFKGMSSENYMNRMANSTVAQVELSFLVLKMKLHEDCNGGRDGPACGRRTKIMSGRGETEDYRRLAGRYNGGGYGSTYARKISACYSCLRGKMSATATNMGREIQTCLNQAK